MEHVSGHSLEPGREDWTGVILSAFFDILSCLSIGLVFARHFWGEHDG